MNRFDHFLNILKKSITSLDDWRSSYGSDLSSRDSENFDTKQIETILAELEERLQGNYPFHHPQYAGQMLKPPHPIAWLAYSLASTINPNNHALDGGPPTSEMEKEVIEKMAGMVGYSDNFLGHLTSGGTIANLEALFVAREIHPEKAIAATANAHYTHQRMCRVLNSRFIEIPVNPDGVPDFTFIKNNADIIGTIVVTMGTTGLGTVEPLDEILEIAQNNGLRVHADAAYGGFFKLIEDQLPSLRHWKRLADCDSIVIDPHKHGLQPYGCGSVIYRDAAVGRFFKHDSPYTYFTSDDLHLGEISLECSRAGASAAAFWATLELMPLTKNGLGSILERTRNSAVKFASLIEKEENWQLYNQPELDITGYFKLPDEKSIYALNKLNQSIFEAGMKAKENGFHLSLFKVPASDFSFRYPDFKTDAEHAVILRSVFMKDEHYNFVDELARRLFETEIGS